MKIYNKPITGYEALSLHGEYEVLSAFYKAFNTQNIDAMQSNWSIQNSVMDNPLGGILRGWSEISEVYKKIFFGEVEVYVEFYDYSLYKQGELFFVAGRERGHIIKNSEKIKLDIRTSRIYAKEEGQYKQVHHHGSITDVILLDTYQKLVMEVL
ncbi:YybH family protein [Sulfurovum sp. NBC37-1]|uniref:YybH family protein n=1 Tax=Sulfurovum sp. (strain NBC37-1) TaxID=387093 RepID=UPI0001587698|nr:nuclear transport factor 2 family protein [Sulfurovum sp. NBC37-1]BAF71889.1 conserved hypothetical protein [Sulfurovum sp. NBC37-1]